MPKGQQIDKGRLRSQIGQREKQAEKKTHRRKIRRASFDTTPQPNRYSGGWCF